MKNRYLSRKFLLAIGGGVVVIVNAILEANGMKAMDTDTVVGFLGLLATYILGEAYVDARK